MNDFEIRIAQVLGHDIWQEDVAALSNLKLKLKEGRAKGSEFNKAIDLLEAKIKAAKEAAGRLLKTDLTLETGRSHHILTVKSEGIWGEGATCCDTRRFGCVYLGTCKARPPRSGWVAILRKP